ncbi:MAG: malto-oligosyltrehalose trehalohydrolase [Candidatus Acidiferrales bacterium]
MPFGAELHREGGVRFSLWAPAQNRVRLLVNSQNEPLTMEARSGGWHERIAREVKAGDRYRFLLEDSMRVPDPASRYQPEDIHGPSEVIDPASYRWINQSWSGRPWHECVFYELHVGTFTPQGTFRSIIDKLDYLRDLGITAVELMPIADFPGTRNWGYDGVLLYAPDSSYGRPDDLKALIDAAHGKGLMIFLDVVYNHFGPEGNFIPTYAPQLFTGRHHTPWGNAVNYDGHESRTVRDFVIHNALYWIEEFQFDGLRLDAVQAIVDDSPKHILEELAERVHQSVGAARHVHLVLENGSNQSRFLVRNGENRPRWYAAQWNDDLHHALHVAATRENGGYYIDYAGDLAKLGRSLAEGFSFQGDRSAFAQGNPRGEPSAFLPPPAFVGFIQNHDQVGNRAWGERLTAIAPPEAVRAIASIYLLCPHIPMLFMGEEWAESQPFPFFCDFTGELADAVRNGRHAEFASFPQFLDPVAREKIPDPISPATFELAKLKWEELGMPVHRRWLSWYRNILAVRGKEIIPRLHNVMGRQATYAVAGKVLAVNWRLGDGSQLMLRACLSDEASPNGFDLQGRVIWREGESPDSKFDSRTDSRMDSRTGSRLIQPWSVLWSIVESP